MINVCQGVNSNMKILRAKFSEITKVSVERALRTLVQPDAQVSRAVDVRQELDLRIGAAFTRFQTMRLKNKFAILADKKVISYGSW